MKRKIVSLLLSVALIIACLPVTAIADTGIEINATNFPDPVFREYVSNCFDDGDGVLSFYEMYYAVQIEIGDNNAISSLEGIKYLLNLQLLYIYRCPNVTSLDVSGMTSLKYLECFSLNLSSLNVSGCSNLIDLYCDYNNVSSINLSSCTRLVHFSCIGNSITSLDVSNCKNLQYLDCSCCQLSSLNVSGCTNITVIHCYDNNLNSINVRGLSKLTNLDVSGNPLKNVYIGDSSTLCDNYLGRCTVTTGIDYYRKDGTYDRVNYGSYYFLWVDPEDTVYGCTQRKPDPMPSLPSPSKSAGDFVTRCYNVALGRNPDTAGYNNYLNNLKAGKACGGQVAHNFIFSQEYINKNKSNEAFVDDLYQMFFGRGRGEGEGQAWINELDAGVKDREQVFNGFVNSQEFFDLCKDYGITAGYYVSGVASSKQGGVNCFVERLYEVCLGRRSDIGGQKTWASGLMAGTVTGSSCVHGFLFSAEFTNKNLNDLDFVAYTYRAFFGREADAEGLKTWMNYLGNGGTREGMFNGFVGSQEFKNLCSSYGINP